MNAGIAVDNWKLPVFRRRLTEAGFECLDGGAFTPDTTLLTVETNDVAALQAVLRDCQAECRRSRP